jgi:hypothetical protein
MRHPISDAPPRIPAPPTENGEGGDDRGWKELADVLAPISSATGS